MPPYFLGHWEGIFLCQPRAYYLPWTPGTPTWQGHLGQVQEGGGENPEVCLRRLSCRVDLDFLSIFTSKGLRIEMQIPRPLASSVNQHSRNGIQQCVGFTDLQGDGAGGVCKPRPNFTRPNVFPHNWVTACPYAIYLVNTQRLLILHSKGSFENYFGKQARMLKLCFTCILCSFSWLLWECGLFQIKPMILVYKAWGLYGRAYLWETFAS